MGRKNRRGSSPRTAVKVPQSNLEDVLAQIRLRAADGVPPQTLLIRDRGRCIALPVVGISDRRLMPSSLPPWPGPSPWWRCLGASSSGRCALTGDWLTR